MAIQSPNSKEDLNAIHATENAISAVTKVCKYIDTGVPLDSILPLWLSWLPVTEDKEEASHVYNYLCDLIERLVYESSPALLWVAATNTHIICTHACTHACTNTPCSNNSVILGQDNGNVPRILGIIADVCSEDVLQDYEQVYLRLLSIARHFQVRAQLV